MHKMPLWFLPAGMAAWNALFFCITLAAEGRVKPNVALYVFRYSSTIYPAMKGDIHPFITVFQS